MIRFQQVSKAYRGGRQALQKVDFHLRRGEMAFLGGHSGAGKSTLLKLICAIERPTDGKISFNGHDITRIPNKDIPFLRRNIGIVFQDHRLLMDRSIYDNVALPMRIESISENEINVVFRRRSIKPDCSIKPAAYQASSLVGNSSESGLLARW